MAHQGLITRASDFDPTETMNRLEAAVQRRGATILARIDHAAAAASVHLPLRPTAVLIFGNPKTGTPLMQVEQTTGIDLPLKALVWQDADRKTQLSYNAPQWIAERHAVEGAEQTVAAMRETLVAIVDEATKKEPT
ncbi:DUF302 domain-containing protein [Hyphomicrobium sp.]|uniref:DUF302 domain-containing protein n=1 Tax=Hyphomicrobium sp. TaxID=82 RepID=UPI002E32DE3B|nr:DUF302 domain-containing protein [Hyphomicrobium sp.]HEX2843487.1 DUF302 domain-containing protein [Hyphomicrobium sp.]